MASCQRSFPCLHFGRPMISQQHKSAKLVPVDCPIRVDVDLHKHPTKFVVRKGCPEDVLEAFGELIEIQCAISALVGFLEDLFQLDQDVQINVVLQDGIAIDGHATLSSKRADSYTSD